MKKKQITEVSTPVQLKGMDISLDGFQTTVIDPKIEKFSVSNLSIAINRQGYPRSYVNVRLKVNMKTGLFELEELEARHDSIFSKLTMAQLPSHSKQVLDKKKQKESGVSTPDPADVVEDAVDKLLDIVG